MEWIDTILAIISSIVALGLGAYASAMIKESKELYETINKAWEDKQISDKEAADIAKEGVEAFIAGKNFWSRLKKLWKK